jgi:hypothetical protein
MEVTKHPSIEVSEHTPSEIRSMIIEASEQRTRRSEQKYRREHRRDEISKTPPGNTSIARLFAIRKVE